MMLRRAQERVRGARFARAGTRRNARRYPPVFGSAPSHPIYLSDISDYIRCPMYELSLEVSLSQEYCFKTHPRTCARSIDAFRASLSAARLSPRLAFPRRSRLLLERSCRGRFLKLVAHRCHINRQNLFNQVGVVAVNVLGEYAPRVRPAQKRQP